MSKLRYDVKQKIIDIAGTCFWYKKNFYDFLETCGINREHYLRYENETGKYNIMRNIISDLEDSGKDELLKNIQSNLYKLKTVPDKNVPDITLAKQNLSEFKEMCGKDIVEEEIKRKKFSEEINKRQFKIDKQTSFNTKVEELKNDFIKLLGENNKQKRGFSLENLVYNLFLVNEIEAQKSYKSNNEQIDGYFILDGFNYLIESKWIKGNIKQTELAIFDKKVDKKLQSTRGLCIAINGFDNEAVQSFSSNKPRLLLLDGEDLMCILDNKVLLKDALRAKIDAAAKNGNIFFKLKNIL